MYRIRNCIIPALFICVMICGCHNKIDISVIKLGEQHDGSIFVPSNQLLRPSGFQLYLPGRPVDLALTPDEKFLLVKNRSDLDLIRISDRTIIQSLPYEKAVHHLQACVFLPTDVRFMSLMPTIGYVWQR
jgi:hypothetical protein